MRSSVVCCSFLSDPVAKVVFSSLVKADKSASSADSTKFIFAEKLQSNKKQIKK